MNNKLSYSFLMEFIVVIVIFSICATICISVFTSSYKKNELANRKKDALEEAINYIERKDYSIKEFAKNSINYKINVESDNYIITATYKGEELFFIEFHGGDYE